MTLLAPSRLLLLVPVVVLVVGYLVAQRRHRGPAVRHPDLALLDAAAGRASGWRRHLVALGMFGATVAMVLGLARPAQATAIERRDGVVVLAIDTSRSMTATDVSPNRLAAAQAAASRFVEQAPDGYRIGLVTFDAQARTLASPTTDHDQVLEAIAALQPGNGTASGEGLAAAVELVQAAGEGASGDEADNRSIVLLADGDTTTGRSLADATPAAVDAEIPVFTIAFGTPDATITVDGRTLPAGADQAAIAAVAEATGGTDHTASTGAELNEVYERIGTTITAGTEMVELTVPLTVVAAGLLALALVGSIVWTPTFSEPTRLRFG